MKPLLDLNFHDCRWPIDEQDGKHFFCAAPRDGKSSYCVKHRQIARGKSSGQPFVPRAFRKTESVKPSHGSHITKEFMAAAGVSKTEDAA